jgi:membrane protein YdbS with pleckstrin-like domain
MKGREIRYLVGGIILLLLPFVQLCIVCFSKTEDFINKLSIGVIVIFFVIIAIIVIDAFKK